MKNDKKHLSKLDAGSWYIWPCWLPLGGEGALLSGSGREKRMVLSMGLNENLIEKLQNI